MNQTEMCVWTNTQFKCDIDSTKTWSKKINDALNDYFHYCLIYIFIYFTLKNTSENQLLKMSL